MVVWALTALSCCHTEFGYHDVSVSTSVRWQMELAVLLVQRWSEWRAWRVLMWKGVCLSLVRACMCSREFACACVRVRECVNALPCNVGAYTCACMCSCLSVHACGRWYGNVSAWIKWPLSNPGNRHMSFVCNVLNRKTVLASAGAGGGGTPPHPPLLQLQCNQGVVYPIRCCSFRLSEGMITPPSLLLQLRFHWRGVYIYIYIYTYIRRPFSVGVRKNWHSYAHIRSLSTNFKPRFLNPK